MAASVALQDILEEVTRNDTEDVQDFTDEETDLKTKAIESVINFFAVILAKKSNQQDKIVNLEGFTMNMFEGTIQLQCCWNHHSA